jgi:hypothetical protein
MQEKQQQTSRNTQAELRVHTEHTNQRSITPKKKTKAVNYSP